MNPDIMQQLAMLLAGTQQAAPAQPQIQQPMQQAQSPAQHTGMIPGRPGSWPGSDPTPPGVPTPGNGGKGGQHRPLTAAQKQENRGALRGPAGYTPVMKANVGMKAGTPGYGNNPTPTPSGFTQFIDLFTPPKGDV